MQTEKHTSVDSALINKVATTQKESVFFYFFLFIYVPIFTQNKSVLCCHVSYSIFWISPVLTGYASERQQNKTIKFLLCLIPCEHKNIQHRSETTIGQLCDCLSGHFPTRVTLNTVCDERKFCLNSSVCTSGSVVSLSCSGKFHV